MTIVHRALTAFLRASSLHIGAAAATAALREELTLEHPVTPRDIDAAYAVSRITPGTNLLALYAQLGHNLGGWPLAGQAVAVGRERGCSVRAADSAQLACCRPDEAVGGYNLARETETTVAPLRRQMGYR